MARSRPAATSCPTRWLTRPTSWSPARARWSRSSTPLRVSAGDAGRRGLGASIGQVRVVAAPDKFRGTATAAEVAAAVGRAAATGRLGCDEVPVADGGEGTLEVLGGANRTATVTGPLGEPVEAALAARRAGRRSSRWPRRPGWRLAGGAEGNDPIAADTVRHRRADPAGGRVRSAAGSSSASAGRPRSTAASAPCGRCTRTSATGPSICEVACDVRTTFLDAAEVFGPQKGASAAQVRLLTNRLARLADVYEEDHGVDVRDLPGTGAAGGLAGGLAALGAQLDRRLRPHRRGDRARRAPRRRRPGHHRRGVPRRRVVRRQGRRRRRRAGGRLRRPRGRHRRPGGRRRRPTVPTRRRGDLAGRALRRRGVDDRHHRVRRARSSARSCAAVSG